MAITQGTKSPFCLLTLPAGLEGTVSSTTPTGDFFFSSTINLHQHPNLLIKFWVYDIWPDVGILYESMNSLTELESETEQLWPAQTA